MSENTFKPQIVVVYGTLRAGEGNHRILSQGDAKLLGTFKSPATYTMYRYGGFPIAKETGKTALTLEAYEVTSEETMSRLNSLEGCTGITGHPRNWYDIVPIETPYGEGKIYVQNNYNGSAESVIESGDWCKR